MIRISLTILFTLCTLCMNLHPVQASDAGYVYDELNVHVEVNEKREYHVTETMVIDFQEDMHGIIRDIPKNSDVEKVLIKNIEVSGMPFTYKDNGDAVQVRIGDEDTLISGKKEITLSYTLKHYQDYDQTYDYIYVNVLGTDYDTEIRKFHAEITFPSSDLLQKYKVTSGRASSTSNNYVDVQLAGDTLIMDTQDTIPAKVGVTAQLRFPNGVFQKAPEYQYPYIIKQNETQIEINEEQDFLVQQTITYQANETNTFMEFPLISKNWEEDMYRIDDLKVSENCNYSIEDTYIYVRSGEEVNTITISYKVHPYYLFDGEQTLALNNTKEDTTIENYRLTMLLPYQPEVKLRMQRPGDGLDANRYQLDYLDNGILLSTHGSIAAGEEFSITLPLYQAYFHRSGSLYIWLTIGIAGLLILLTTALRFVVYRKKDLIIPVNFYPPKGINSAEAGYIIDLKVSDTDITSMIFYWADKGYLRINDINKEYVFEKIKDIDLTAPAYERTLFTQMFMHGDGVIVKKDDLENKFYRDIKVAQSSIQKKYSGKASLRIASVERIRKLCMMMSVVPVILYVLLSTYEVYQASFHLYKSCFLMILALCIGRFFWTQSSKSDIGTKMGSIAKWYFRVMALVVAGIFIIATGIKFTPSFIFCALSSFVIFIFANGIHQDSEYRNELLTSLLGFKEFIETVEKDKLEMLLEEDPEYYYHVLPYAQVLHVSDIWIRKFKDITMEPPQWYVSDDIFYYSAFSMAIHNIERDMKTASTRPASSNGSGSSSGFSGGGGGFSGGGFSGGGSGGGGSRGW